MTRSRNSLILYLGFSIGSAMRPAKSNSAALGKTGWDVRSSGSFVYVGSRPLSTNPQSFVHAAGRVAGAVLVLPALLRRLDRLCPDYKT